MKIEDQVCSVKTALQLKQLGIEQFKSLYAYCNYFPDPTGAHEGYTVCISNESELARISTHIVDTFTVAELGLLLPQNINESTVSKEYPEVFEEEWFLEMYKDSSNKQKEEWFLVRYVISDGFYKVEIKAGLNIKHEAQARAEMLVYLLENKLLTAEYCNKKLNEYA